VQEYVQEELQSGLLLHPDSVTIDLTPSTWNLYQLNHKDVKVLVPKAAGCLMLMTTCALPNFTGKGGWKSNDTK